MIAGYVTRVKGWMSILKKDRGSFWDRSQSFIRAMRVFGGPDIGSSGMGEVLMSCVAILVSIGTSASVLVLMIPLSAPSTGT